MNTKYMRGTITMYDGRRLPFKSGYSDTSKAADDLNLTAGDITNGQIPLSYTIHLAYHALRRQGDLENIGFDAFYDMVADQEMDESPESEGPPAP